MDNIKWHVSDADIYRTNIGVIIEVKNKNKLEDDFYEYALYSSYL